MKRFALIAALLLAVLAIAGSVQAGGCHQNAIVLQQPQAVVFPGFQSVSPFVHSQPLLFQPQQFVVARPIVQQHVVQQRIVQQKIVQQRVVQQQPFVQRQVIRSQPLLFPRLRGF